jgi:carboxylate-amine ligase
MKDFYWDIRPKPEFGTVELRICDTPLTIEKAAEIAAFAQLLAHWLLENRHTLSREIYLTYLINRFRASRYGFDAEIIDPITREHFLLSNDLIRTCQALENTSLLYGSTDALQKISKAVLTGQNGATWLRTRYKDYHSLDDTVRSQIDLWKNSDI